MSYEEKGKWIYLMTMLGTYVGYVAVVLSRADGASVAEVAYVAPILWSIGIAIGLSIVGRIALEIAKPSDNHKIDARDREINRLGEYIGGVILATAMVVPLGLTMLEAKHFWIANAIYLALVVSQSIATMVTLVAYRRGL